ncbi:MAG: 16S rRNA (cytosine(1402)-N(4))-methyltransferase RsmH [Proteobacteria bacterium]|nr:16S rRNA (cytosine(1402)-N(4))-methyltransferase RsmH [Pseudomonadota bacterium]
MADRALGLLALSPGSVAVDATLGGGGHAALMLQAVSPGGVLVGIDRDESAIEEASARLSSMPGDSRIVKARMSEIADVLEGLGLDGADGVIADLGVSSRHLDDGERGFSFMRDGPLDMRMDRECELTAADLIRGSSAAELERVIREYGEERFAGRIARSIAGRSDIDTTAKLADAVQRAMPFRRRGRIHPATRTFQALRIAVNDEIGELEKFLEAAPLVLKPGGRLVVMSYHSLEDRLVKHRFRRLAASGRFELLSKRALAPEDDETDQNPRARSAKLRAIRRAG